MKTYQKLIQFVVALALLAGVIAFTAYFPGSENNVAWNSRMAWYSGGTLPMPNVAWNSGVAWVPNLEPTNVAWNSRVAWISGGTLPMPNVAWNSGVAWCDGGGLFTPNVAWNSGVAWVPDVSPLSVAWNT